jgi:hypothetical protein
MKKSYTSFALLCLTCSVFININLFAQSTGKLTYNNKWDEDMKWGLIREIEVEKDQSRLDVDGLDIIKDGLYFMVFIPINPTSKSTRYLAWVNDDLDPGHYCTSYLEIESGKRRQAGYYDEEPPAGRGDAGSASSYLGRADAGCSSLTTFTLLLDGTHHARWKTWATSGTPDNVIVSSRGSHHRKTVKNVTKFSILSDINNAIGAGSKLLIYGKLMSAESLPTIKEFTVTEDCTEFTIEGLDAERDGAYCLYFMPDNTTDNEVKYNLYVNDDRTDNNYSSVWYGVHNTRGPEEGGADFADGAEQSPMIARADGNSSLTNHTWVGLDVNGHMRYWCEEASGKYSKVRAYGGFYKKKIDNLNKLTIRSDVENGLAAGSRIMIYSGNIDPYPEDRSSSKTRILEYRWYKDIKVEGDLSELDIKNLDLAAAGFLNMDLIPNNRTLPEDPGGPGHYWSYVNGDMNNLNYCDAHFDVQEGVLCAIGGHLEPYYGWAYPQTSSHQPALFMRDARGHVRSRGYGTCHVQGNMQIGKQSICGRAFHHTKYIDTMTSLRVITDAEGGIGKGTRILIFGGFPVSD